VMVATAASCETVFRVLRGRCTSIGARQEAFTKHGNAYDLNQPWWKRKFIIVGLLKSGKGNIRPTERVKYIAGHTWYSGVAKSFTKR
jgi:hypothetical protein